MKDISLESTGPLKWAADGGGTSLDLEPLDAVPRGWYSAAKSVLDVVLAIPLLILSLPIIALAMAAVRMSSRGPAIYSQPRLGFRGRPFTIYKIRTMYNRCEEQSGAIWSDLRSDHRVTPVGWYLRKFKIDELPQLWNVIRGEMSLVGPRPERPPIVDQLDAAIPHYLCRLLVRPGVTGLAQVQLPPDTDFESVRRKLACDLYYIRHLSLAMDLRILLGTASYLAGIPFWYSKTLFRIPSQEIAEHSYRRMVEASPRRVQPA